MTALAIFDRFIADENGNLVGGATVSVLREIDGIPPALFSERDGSVGLSNSYTNASDNARVQFFVTGGTYRVTVTKGGFSVEFRYVAIGTMAENDVEILATLNAAIIPVSHTLFGGL